MAHPHLLVETDGPVRTLTLNALTALAYAMTYLPPIAGGPLLSGSRTCSRAAAS